MIPRRAPLFDTRDPLNRAAAIIRERISALPEFARARSIVVMGAFDECRGRDVGGMRELGGFTEVILRRVAALPDIYRINYGSTLLPRTVVDTLREFAPAMREELQGALCDDRTRALEFGSKFNDPARAEEYR